MQTDASLSTDHRQTLAIIDCSGKHLLGLINNVLDRAMIEAGRTGLVNTALDLRVMMQDISELMGQRADTKGSKLTLEIAVYLPRVIASDESKPRQAVLNLVTNAVKFSSRCGVIVRVTCLPLKSMDAVMLVIEVEDSGDGITSAEQKRISKPVKFDNLYRIC